MMLKPVQECDKHKELLRFLREKCYQGFVSIEMGNGLDIRRLEEVMGYVAEAVKI